MRSSVARPSCHRISSGTQRTPPNRLFGSASSRPSTMSTTRRPRRRRRPSSRSHQSGHSTCQRGTRSGRGTFSPFRGQAWPTGCSTVAKSSTRALLEGGGGGQMDWPPQRYRGVPKGRGGATSSSREPSPTSVSGHRPQVLTIIDLTIIDEDDD
jgi:hypothetical protein